MNDKSIIIANNDNMHIYKINVYKYSYAAERQENIEKYRNCMKYLTWA